MRYLSTWGTSHFSCITNIRVFPCFWCLNLRIVFSAHGAQYVHLIQIIHGDFSFLAYTWISASLLPDQHLHRTLPPMTMTKYAQVKRHPPPLLLQPPTNLLLFSHTTTSGRLCSEIYGPQSRTGAECRSPSEQQPSHGLLQGIFPPHTLSDNANRAATVDVNGSFQGRFP